MKFNSIVGLFLMMFSYHVYSYCQGSLVSKNITVAIPWQHIIFGPSSTQMCNIQTLNQYFTTNNPCGSNTNFVTIIGGNCTYNNSTNGFQFNGTVQCVICKTLPTKSSGPYYE